MDSLYTLLLNHVYFSVIIWSSEYDVKSNTDNEGKESSTTTLPFSPGILKRTISLGKLKQSYSFGDENDLNTIKNTKDNKVTTDDNVKCIFTNKNNYNIKIGMLLSEYLIVNRQLRPTYNKFLLTKKAQSMNNLDENIRVFELSNNTFYEIRTNIKKYNNNNILAHVSSNVRTPLNTILGMISLLTDTELSPLQQSYVTDIENSCYEIISLMNDLVDIVNLGKNNVRIKQKNFNLKKCIIDALQIQFSKHSSVIKLNLKIHDEVSKIIKSDEQRLILINIIKYIIKNTNTDNIDLEVRYYLQDDCKQCPFGCAEEYNDKRNLLFVINDNYMNYNDEYVYQIEETLGMGDYDIKHYTNNDINLLIARFICNLLGGNVWIKINNISDIYSITYCFSIMCGT
jgi:hypothetical protein